MYTSIGARYVWCNTVLCLQWCICIIVCVVCHNVTCVILYNIVDKLHTIYCELLKRLDDSVEDIRLCMTQTLLVYFRYCCLFFLYLMSYAKHYFGPSRAFPDQYDSAFYKAHCEAMYSALLIHLDDSHEMMQVGHM